MAYRRTKDVIARLAAKRERILLAAINVADEQGFDALTMRDVAHAAGVAPGTIYNHYADINELRAAIVAMRLHCDLAAMRTDQTVQISVQTFVHTVRAYLRQHSKTKRLGRVVAAEPVYRIGIVNVLARQIVMLAREDDEDAAILANALYGAFNAVLALRQRVDGVTEKALLSMALRSIGVDSGLIAA